MKIGYYIYKYVYDGEVIYVGKTDSDLNARIRSHAAEFKFQKYIDKANIFYYECKTPHILRYWKFITLTSTNLNLMFR